ncbi:hypothetical protein [Singulisphaera sp. PoT]|uniref:hypothetical protein n=1 Tax=Singulisphaera sp. PoT TaxID=3411797 RepID=UPI003BF4A5DD
MASSSNIDEIGQWLRDLVATVDFTMPGQNASLGKDMADAVALGIQERSVPDAKSADGGTWAANASKYADYKRRRYKTDQPGLRSGQMLSLQSLLGVPQVSPDEVVMQYGIGQAPQRAATGVPLTKSDQEITDIEKAYFFSKDRPFYELDEDIADECVKLAGEALDEHLKNA